MLFLIREKAEKTKRSRCKFNFELRIINLRFVFQAEFFKKNQHDQGMNLSGYKIHDTKTLKQSCNCLGSFRKNLNGIIARFNVLMCGFVFF